MIELLQTNLLSPMVLSFFLGIIAVLLRSDLKFPDQTYTILSIYLLLAIGFKGGASISSCIITDILPSIGATLLAGVILPILAFTLLKVFRYSRVDAAAMAAHFGSVSVITFIACSVFTESLGFKSGEYMTALVAILEVPAIVIALLLARPQVSVFQEISFILSSKSILLLLGGLLIGYLSGQTGLERIAPFFVTPFQGILVIFLLEMGLVAGQKLLETKALTPKLVFLSVLIPLINGVIGVYIAKLAKMGVGDATVFATMTASASYIAAPAAVRMAIPSANPALYISASLLIAFPFNLSLGIPLYHKIARLLILP